MLLGKFVVHVVIGNMELESELIGKVLASLRIRKELLKKLLMYLMLSCS